MEFATHHEFLAVRAAREGRDLYELGHRWVVAEARRTDGWWGMEPGGSATMTQETKARVVPALGHALAAGTGTRICRAHQENGVNPFTFARSETDGLRPE